MNIVLVNNNPDMRVGRKNILMRLTCSVSIIGLLLVFSGSCKKDNDDEQVHESGTLNDIDGNIYQTVVIGSLEWMAGNLKTTRYNDGTPIVSPGPDNKGWETNKTGAYSWYKNDELNYGDKYGALYNWHAVNSGKLCPAGWRVPTDDEWTSASKYLIQDAGQILIESGTNTLEDKDGEDPGKTGFNPLPGGGRFSGISVENRNSADGYFYYEGKAGRWWSSTEHSSSNAWYRSIYPNSGNVFRSYNYKETGFSVRCIRN